MRTNSLYIGVDIGGTKTAVSLSTKDTQIIKKFKFPTKKDSYQVLEDIGISIEELKTIAEKENQEIASIGISCGGPLNREKGIILSPPNLSSWDRIEIVEWLTKRFHIPTFLENDANACALAEWYSGNGKGKSNVIFLTFGTGLGAGLILNNHLYVGKNGLAGEVGHLRIAEDGPYCYHKRGSWESYCSGSGLKGLYKMYYNEDKSGKEICDLADNNDEKALSVIKQSAIHLGKGIALLIDIFDPDCIIIGSIYTRSEELFFPAMMHHIKKEALPESLEGCAILPSYLKEELGDIAALAVAINRLEESKKTYE